MARDCPSPRNQARPTYDGNECDYSQQPMSDDWHSVMQSVQELTARFDEAEGEASQVDDESGTNRVGRVWAGVTQQEASARGSVRAYLSRRGRGRVRNAGPTRLVGRKPPMVEVLVEGVPLWVTLDTGAGPAGCVPLELLSEVFPGEDPAKVHERIVKSETGGVRQIDGTLVSVTGVIHVRLE